jgi:uncharacterized protein YtpQ (UPF0354 family)
MKRQSWIGVLSERAGPLIEPALCFLQRQRAGDSDSFRGGTEGIRWLARELVAFAYLESVSDEEEQAFVEGAGALLGLILIDHLPEARHAAQAGAHRVRIGAYAFIDPFAAIERALEARDIPKALAASLAEAEREARGVGAMSRVVRTLAELLLLERPHLRVAGQFDARLMLAGRNDDEQIEIDLTQAIRATSSQSAQAVQDVARRLISLLPGAQEPEQDFHDLRSRIVPRICRTDAVTSLSKQGRAELFRSEFVSDLSIAILVEHEGRARYLRTREVEAFAISSADLLAYAIENLLLRSTQFRLSELDREAKGCFITRTGDGRDSTRVLLPSVRALLRERFGDHVAVGIPHRDAFLCCDASDSHSVTTIRARVTLDAARAPHRLTDELFRCTPSGLTSHVP